jgi:hypothetical protein
MSPEEWSVEPAESSPAFTVGLRLTLGVLGTGSFGAGVFAVFATDNGTGTGVLLAFGGVVLVLAIMGDRIEAFEFGGTKLRLRAAAADRFVLAEQSERRGDSVEAERLRAQGEALLAAAGSIAADYRQVRGSMRPGRDRTRAMEEVVSRARRLAREQPFDTGEVVRLLRVGTDDERITALAMMQAQPELRDFDAAVAAIEHSRSAFEQYHAMLLASMMLDDLDPDQRVELARVVRAVRGLRFRGDSDRWRLSERILRQLSGAP